MARFLRLVLALAMLPLACGVTRTFVDVFRLIPASGDSIVPPGLLAVSAGVAAFLAAWVFLPAPVRLYVLGHEFTHAVWGLAFGARVSDLKVGVTGGSVRLTKSNVWITLAPYFFPFWTMAVVGLALAVRAVMHFTHPGEPLPVPWLWMFAVGFTWSFHACFTIRSLMQPQPDVQEYGRIFSWTLILVCNILGVLAWIVCTTNISAAALFDCLWAHTVAAYAAVASAGAVAYDIISSARSE